MSNNDLLVDLYDLDFSSIDIPITIKRVLSPNSDEVVEYIGKHFSPKWASEAKAAMYKNHPTCFVAVDNKEIVGFACYDATAKGFFGPLGVSDDYRKRGIGKALVMKCMEGLFYDGYGYAIIGGVSEKTQKFYYDACKAIPIANSRKVYNRLIDR